MSVREFVGLLIAALLVLAVALSGYIGGDISLGNAALGTILMIPCLFVTVKGIASGI